MQDQACELQLALFLSIIILEMKKKGWEKTY